MSLEAYIVLLIIGVVVVLFIWDRFPIDFVALSIIVALTVTGILTPEESISGFSNSATITVAFMFVLSNAMLQTGALQVFGPKLGDLFKSNFNMGMLLMIFFVGISSAFMNNTPIVAMFIPVIQSISHQTNISSSKLLIPLSYASIFGGTCTLMGTSTNMLVSGIAEKNGIDGFNLFTSTPIGFILLILGAVFLYFVARKFLPDRTIFEDQKNDLRNYITEIEILKGSSLVGKSIMDSVFQKDLEVDIIELWRNENIYTLPPGDFEFAAGDILKIRSNIDKIKSLKERLSIDFTNNYLKVGDHYATSGNTSLIEMVVTSGSSFVGSTLRELDFRRLFRAIPLALYRNKEVLNEKIHDAKLEAGDLLLIEMKSHRIENLKRDEMKTDSPFLILSQEGLIDFDKKKFGMVISVFFLVITLSIFKILPLVSSVILGTMLLLITRTIKMNEMYKAINWKIVFVLAGTISLGFAMNKTGLTNQIAELFISISGQFGPIGVLALLYLTTNLLTEVMSNNATAAIFAPIAIVLATEMGVSPLPFLITVMVAASASFITPIGYQTNTMVFTAGGYRFKDFMKIGIWLTLIFWIASVLLIPVFYPF